MTRIAILLLIITWWGPLIPLQYLSASKLPHQGICIRDTSDIKLQSNPDAEDGIKQIPSINVGEQVEYIDMAKTSTVFVDKSLLIKKILKGEQKVILITCPSKTGKSVNLSMLKAFLEIRVKPETNRIVPPTKTSIYKFFTEGVMTQASGSSHMNIDHPLQSNDKMYLNYYCDDEDETYLNSGNVDEEGEGDQLPLPQEEHEHEKGVIIGTYKNAPVISTHKDIVDLHLAKYPIIYLNLFKNLTELSTVSIYDAVKTRIERVFNQHGFLKRIMKQIVDSNCTSEKQKIAARKNLKQFLFYQKELSSPESSQLNATHLENSLLILSKILYDHFRQPVVILMDKYIYPLEYFILDERTNRRSKGGMKAEERKNRDHIKILRNFMRKTLGSENRYLKKAILTGTLSVNKKDLFADVPDYVHYTAVDNDLQQFYGFTETEVQLLFDHFGITKLLAIQARKYYQGYRFKRDTNFVTYNMWSIVHFLKNKKVTGYVAQHAYDCEKLDRIVGLSKLGYSLTPLTDGGNASIRFVEADYDKRDLIISTKNPAPRVNITKEAVDYAFSLFCEIGLLTNSEHSRDVDDRQTLSVCIPNDEIRQHMLACEMKVSRNRFPKSYFTFKA